MILYISNEFRLTNATMNLVLMEVNMIIISFLKINLEILIKCI